MSAANHDGAVAARHAFQGSLSVTGGAGRIAARIEELDELAARLDVIADSAHGVVGALERIRSQLWATCRLAPATGIAASAEGERITGRLRRLAAAITLLAHLARAAARQYADAERQVASWWESAAFRVIRNTFPGGAIAWSVASMLFPYGQGAAATGSLTPGGSATRAAAEWLGLPPLAAVTSGLGRLGAVLPTSPFGSGMASLDRATGGSRAQVTSSWSRPPEPGPHGLSGTVSALVRTYDSDDEHTAAVEVQRITQADGTEAFVVLIPGTDHIVVGPGGRDPSDAASNVRAYLGLPSVPEDLVLQALARAGVGPAAPVMFAGHSQGGIVAMRLAADPAVRARYDVQAVVTIGAPEAHIATSPHVQYLHVAHEEDPIAGLGGERGGEEANRTVVTRALAGSHDPADSPTGGAGFVAHDLSTYERTARHVDASTEPSVQYFMRQTAHFYAGSGAVVASTVVLGERA